MRTVHDSDQLLALALAQVPARHLRSVLTHEEILLAARRARAQAARTRRRLREARKHWATVHAHHAVVHAQLQAALRGER